jgi:cytochrome c-type biogenesis protein
VRAVPWAGAVAGIAITIAGLVILSGRHLGISLNVGPRGRPSNETPSMYLFGVAYAVASLGCTLPVFLSVVGRRSRFEARAPPPWCSPRTASAWAR